MIHKLLIADDNTEILQACSELLKGFGFQVTAVSNFEELERAFLHDTPDLLILDIMFGSDTTGPDFYKKIVEADHAPKVPVIYVSGLVDEYSEIPLIKDGLVAMYAKPFNVKKIVTDIHNAFSSSSPLAA